MRYRSVNNISGCIIAAIAFAVYLATMEHSVSYWDCGEFLSCANKLEVGHAPGAPFFLLLQRFAGMLAPYPAAVALFINSLSALTSALTILFLFWTITHFAKKLITGNNSEPNPKQLILIIGTGTVGALAFAFSDSFWFSAVEAEVYATSSFFTAITFWAILKWDAAADKKYADRWLLLIAYLIGVAIGVHLLNLLAIPAIVMAWYFRRYETNLKGALYAFGIGCGILVLIQYGIIQLVPAMAARFDILFTNSFGMPFDTGSITFLLLFTILLTSLLVIAKKGGHYLSHLFMLCLLFISIGYSSYLLPVIRARANVPVNLGNPDNALSLKTYLSRDELEQQPLVYGPDFSSSFTGFKSVGNIYRRTSKNGRDYYEIIGKKKVPEFDPNSQHLFPRIYDNSKSLNVRFYRSYLGLENGAIPTNADNINFFFRYQLNWMWWRYFMWNYAGRQNDMKGDGEANNGNWISGISFIDAWRGLGDGDKIHTANQQNAANNCLYFLPLLLGLSGLIYQFRRNRKDSIIIMLLFFFTGPAITLYLNLAPLPPREGDYAFVGCTYAFAIWIGIGVLMIQQWLQKKLSSKAATISAVSVCLLIAPVLMAQQEWDDHDRSGKSLARATAYNTLTSLEKDAIYITYEDNNTGPLWYLQEVEGIRRDVRILNVGLLAIDNYIDHLQYKMNDASPVPMIWKQEDYMGDKHNLTKYYTIGNIPSDKYFNLEEVCKFICSKEPVNKISGSNADEKENYLPTKNFYLPILSKSELVAKGWLNIIDTGRISVDMKFIFPNDFLNKSDLAVLNILAANAREGWRRPIYFDMDLPSGIYAGMDDYIEQTGLVYRLLPFHYTDSSKHAGGKRINTEKSYAMFMNTYLWGGAERDNVYFDETNRKMLKPYRINASLIADELTEEGKKEMALRLLNKVTEKITEHSFPYDITGYKLAASYYKAGAKEKALAIALKTIKNAENFLDWATTVSEEGKQRMTENGDILQNIQIIGSLGDIMLANGDSTNGNLFAARATQYYNSFETNLKPLNK